MSAPPCPIHGPGPYQGVAHCPQCAVATMCDPDCDSRGHVSTCPKITLGEIDPAAKPECACPQWASNYQGAHVEGCPAYREA